MQWDSLLRREGHTEGAPWVHSRSLCCGGICCGSLCCGSLCCGEEGTPEAHLGCTLGASAVGASAVGASAVQRRAYLGRTFRGSKEPLLRRQRARTAGPGRPSPRERGAPPAGAPGCGAGTLPGDAPRAYLRCTGAAAEGRRYGPGLDARVRAILCGSERRRRGFQGRDQEGPISCGFLLSGLACGMMECNQT